MDRNYLVKTADELVTSTEGILAADQSPISAGKLLAIAGVENSEDSRRKYRQILLTTPEYEQYINAVILHDETIRQVSDDGLGFPKLLEEKGVIAGIKVDAGVVDFPNFPGEKLTQGLDGLSKHLEEYKDLGARFAKWRAVIAIDENTPNRPVISANMKNTAIYAAFCQEAGIVPIVEPEVLMSGGHDIKRCEDVTRMTLEMLFSELFDHKVILEATILKVNLIVSGKDNPNKLSSEKIAEHTVRVMKEAVSVAIPSIVFLSGGLTPEESTKYLDAVNKLGPHPWEFNFSFGRALQEPVLAAWQGKDENIGAAQREFLKRARLNSLALRGEYNASMEDEG